MYYRNQNNFVKYFEYYFRKFEYYFRNILPVGNIPRTMSSQQARSIATCIYLLSEVHCDWEHLPQSSAHKGIHRCPYPVFDVEH